MNYNGKTDWYHAILPTMSLILIVFLVTTLYLLPSESKSRIQQVEYNNPTIQNSVIWNCEHSVYYLNGSVASYQGFARVNKDSNITILTGSPNSDIKISNKKYKKIISSIIKGCIIFDGKEIK